MIRNREHKEEEERDNKRRNVYNHEMDEMFEDFHNNFPDFDRMYANFEDFNENVIDCDNDTIDEAITKVDIHELCCIEESITKGALLKKIEQMEKVVKSQKLMIAELQQRTLNLTEVKLPVIMNTFSIFLTHLEESSFITVMEDFFIFRFAKYKEAFREAIVSNQIIGLHCHQLAQKKLGNLFNNKNLVLKKSESIIITIQMLLLIDRLQDLFPKGIYKNIKISTIVEKVFMNGVSYIQCVQETDFICKSFGKMKYTGLFFAPSTRKRDIYIDFHSLKNWFIKDTALEVIGVI